VTDRPTWLIAGLGNPGSRYRNTRHNIGFMVVDRLRRRLPGGVARRRFDGEIIEVTDGPNRVVLVKPDTYMNRSGQAIAPAARWYRVPYERVLVIYDDMDLPFGQLRLRPNGSSGGHNGLESIIGQFGTQAFPRLRVGISRPMRGDPIGFVLSRFSSDEERELPRVLDEAADAVLLWQREGIDVAMNRFNRRSSGRIGDPTRSVEPSGRDQAG
jgi:PTH1 family peptidyl-tRNA hydrolase